MNSDIVLEKQRNGTLKLGCLFVATAGKGATMEPLLLHLQNDDDDDDGAKKKNKYTTSDARANNDEAEQTDEEELTIQPQRIHTSTTPSSTTTTTTTTSFSNLIVAESFDSGHSDFSLSASIAKGLGIPTTSSTPIRIDSMSKYGLLSRGDAHVYLRFPTKQGYVEAVWDHAPGALLLQESGGEVTDAFGAPLDFQIGGRKLTANYGVIASMNKDVHKRVLEEVKIALEQQKKK